MTTSRCAPPRLRHRRSHGFTLIELVVVIVVSSIVVGFAAMLITTPMNSYFTQSRRSELTESADGLTRQMTTDLRRALPLSVRISNVGTRSIVEFLVADEVAFYRTGGTGDATQELVIGTADSQFSSIGQFADGPPLPARPFTLTPNPANFNPRLSIGNLGASPNDAYQTANNRVMTPATTSIQLNASASAGEDRIQLSATFNFRNASPTNRLFLVTDAVTYICNSAVNARTLRRYRNYVPGATISPNESTARLNAGGVVNTIVARDVTACRLSCQAGTVAPCVGSLVSEITVSRTTNSGTDSMRVLVQAPMEAAP